MNVNMKITSELVKDGKITIKRTDFESFKVVRDYNEQAFVDKLRMKQVEELKRGIKVLNILIIVGMCIAYGFHMFDKVSNPLVIILVLAVMFLIAIIKQSYLIYAIVSSLLIMLNVIFSILFVANVILIGWMEYLERPLRDKLGYPKFDKIEIIHEEPSAMERNENSEERYGDIWSN